MTKFGDDGHERTPGGGGGTAPDHSNITKYVSALLRNTVIN